MASSQTSRLPNMDFPDKLTLVHFERTTPELIIKDFIPLYPRYIISADKAHAMTVLVLMPESMIRDDIIYPALEGRVHKSFAKIQNSDEYFRHPASALFSAHGGYVWSPTNNIAFRSQHQMASMVVHFLSRMNTTVNDDDIKKMSDSYISFMKPEPDWPEDDERPSILPVPTTPRVLPVDAQIVLPPPSTPYVPPTQARPIIPFAEARKAPMYVSLAPRLSDGDGCVDEPKTGLIDKAAADIMAFQNERTNVILQAMHTNSRAQAEVVSTHFIQKTGEYFQHHLVPHMFRIVDHNITGYCMGSLRSATKKTIDQSTTNAMDKMQIQLSEVIEKVTENKVRDVVEKALATSVPIAIDRALKAKAETAVERALASALEKSLDASISNAVEKAVDKSLKNGITKSTLKTVQDSIDETLNHKMGRILERALYEKTGKCVEDALATHTEASLSKACSSPKFERLLDAAVDKVLRKRAREDDQPPAKKMAMVMAKNSTGV